MAGRTLRSRNPIEPSTSSTSTICPSQAVESPSSILGTLNFLVSEVAELKASIQSMNLVGLGDAITDLAARISKQEEAASSIKLKDRCRNAVRELGHTWKDLLSKRNAAFFNYLKCKEKSELYSTWIEDSPDFLPLKFRPKPIAGNNPKIEALRLTNAHSNYRSEAKALLAYSTTHLEKLESLEQQLIFIVDGLTDDEDLRKDILEQWKIDKSHGESTSKDRWDKRKAFLKKKKDEFEHGTTDPVPERDVRAQDDDPKTMTGKTTTKNDKLSTGRGRGKFSGPKVALTFAEIADNRPAGPKNSKNSANSKNKRRDTVANKNNKSNFTVRKDFSNFKHGSAPPQLSPPTGPPHNFSSFTPPPFTPPSLNTPSLLHFTPPPSGLPPPPGFSSPAYHHFLYPHQYPPRPPLPHPHHQYHG